MDARLTATLALGYLAIVRCRRLHALRSIPHTPSCRRRRALADPPRRVLTLLSALPLAASLSRRPTA